MKAVAPWTTRILEAYKTLNPIVDELETLRKTLTEQIETNAADETAHFSKEEAEAIRSRLDEFATKLTELIAKSADQEKQLREAQIEIKSLKSDLELFPRNVWLRMAAGKVINLVKKVATSKEGRELGVAAAKKFLLEGPN